MDRNAKQVKALKVALGATVGMLLVVGGLFAGRLVATQPASAEQPQTTVVLQSEDGKKAKVLESSSSNSGSSARSSGSTTRRSAPTGVTFIGSSTTSDSDFDEGDATAINDVEIDEDHGEQDDHAEDGVEGDRGDDATLDPGQPEEDDQDDQDPPADEQQQQAPVREREPAPIQAEPQD